MFYPDIFKIDPKMLILLNGLFTKPKKSDL